MSLAHDHGYIGVKCTGSNDSERPLQRTSPHVIDVPIRCMLYIQCLANVLLSYVLSVCVCVCVCIDLATISVSVGFWTCRTSMKEA